MADEIVELRPEVAAFAQLMEKKLRLKDKDFPNGWKNDRPRKLFWRLKEEVLELQNELILADRYGINAVRSTLPFEAADIANFAMMIVDTTTTGLVTK